MSELVDQISKLEAKAHALKESVSTPILLPLSRENTLRPLRSSTSWSQCKKSSMEKEQNLFWNHLKKLQSFATSFPCLSCRKVSYIFIYLKTILENFKINNSELKTIAKDLKKSLSVGGSVKENYIIIQGDYRDKIMSMLKGKGFKVKRVGG